MHGRSGNRQCSYTQMLPWTRRQQKRQEKSSTHGQGKEVRWEQSTNWCRWHHNHITGLPKKNLVTERRKFFTRNEQPEETMMVTSQNWGTYCRPVSSKTWEMHWYCASCLMESNQVKWNVCCYRRDHCQLRESYWDMQSRWRYKKQLQLMLQEKKFKR